MLTDDIYDSKIQALFRHMEESEAKARPEFTNNDDPDYLKFVAAVDANSKRWKAKEPVRRRKLYALWWISTTFRSHWEHPTQDTMSQMIWTMFQYETRRREVGCIVEAWMRWHGRNPSEADRKNIMTVIDGVQKDVEPSIKQKKQDRYKRRKEERRMLHRKRGRPIEHDGLRARIVEALKEGRSTPAALSGELGADRNTVKSALGRMLKAGEVVIIGRGLYSLPSIKVRETQPAVQVAETAPQQPEADNARPTKEQLLHLFGLINLRGHKWDQERFAAEYKDLGIYRILKFANVESLEDLNSPRASLTCHYCRQATHCKEHGFYPDRS